MPFCQVPTQDFILSENGKCGNKIMPNQPLHICEYHFNILKNSPPNPKKSFSPRNICVGCKSESDVFLFMNGFCDNCIIDSKASNLTLSTILELFTKKPDILNICDKNLIILFKDMLSEVDRSIPRDFYFEIQNDYKRILIKDRFNSILNIISYDKNFNLFLEKTGGYYSFL